MIGSALGDDDAGRKTVDMLKGMGVGGNFELRRDIETPLRSISPTPVVAGLTIGSAAPNCSQPLGDADMSPLNGASMLYVDCTIRRTSNAPCAKRGS